MKHKPDSWNGPTSESQRGVRRSLTRAGLQLGQLSQVVSGALNTLQGGANPRGAAQTRMRALLNQDRALLSHRACGQASLVDDADVPEVPVKGSQTRGAAQNRMRELLHQDRALLALRERAGEIDDDFAVEVDHALDTLETRVTRETPTAVPTVAVSTVTVSDASSAARVSCVGATTSFAAEPCIASVCTPGPLPAAVETPKPVAVSPVKVVSVEAPKVVLTPEQAKAPLVSPRPAPAPAPVADAASGDAKPDPIRTRGMAKLLALQGYKDRALSIYDELIAAEPNNAELRAEADRLRN